MGAPTEHFFAELTDRRFEPALRPFSGTVLFELRQDSGVDRYFLTIDKGQLAVSRDGMDPDCTLRADTATFDALATGALNPVQALLRGLIEIDGQGILMAALRRVFPASGKAPRARSA